MKQGTPESIWFVDQTDSSIEGYAAQFTINHGQQIDFKINTDATNYRIDIYRLGYYGGNGARLVDSITKNLAATQDQPDPIFDPSTKLVDAGNWSVSASWNIPGDAVSGVYIANLTRLDGGGKNTIPFIVRDDENASAITFQTSDTTWQAYNWWGGYNFYGGVDQSGHIGRANAVSYNRPIITRDGGFAAGPQDFVFGEEYPAIRWIEQNGYDVNYIAGIDTARDASQLLNSQIFLSVGHDEYWSADQRANVKAARDAGVNLAFLSGNEVYWEARWANSIDGSGTPYKTLVSYKETWDNADIDPGHTTATWRDPRFGAGDPENALTGTIFTVDSYRLDTIKIPHSLSNFRFWSNTAVADIQPGQVYSLTPNLLGYEWDSDLDNGFRPAGLINLSSTTVDVNSLLLDNGNTTGPGTATHSLTLYRAASGALVFGAGTVYWTWGLDSHHDNEATPTDPNVQQAMVNLFADMGVQPATLMVSLVAATQSTDTTAPTSTITSPTATGSPTATQPITISGTAVDSGGGSIAVVEVSTDGGLRWHRAIGFENWSYQWTPLTGGDYTILSRAVDDSVNMETPTTGTTIAVAAIPTTTFFSSTDEPAIASESDFNFINLGVKFTSSQPGSIVGIRYYKGLGDGGTHVGSLWSSTGALLASATFTQETSSGWQTVTFGGAVPITAGVTYIASYHSHGQYAATRNYFTTPSTSGPLTTQGGIFLYNNNIAFPTQQSDSNYWVDVIYSPLVPVAPSFDHVSLFSSTDTPAIASVVDPNQVNLGARFVASSDGVITGIKYYKSATDTGPHAGSLWTGSGTLLATAIFTNETASGWQTMTFSSPVAITASTTYVASYHSNGNYAATGGYFEVGHTKGPLTAPAGNNGVYAYGSGNLFPNSTYNATNYWVDVLFSSGNGSVNHNPIATDDTGFSATQNVALSIPASALLADDSDPDGDALTVTGVSGGQHGIASFNAQTNTVTYTPNTGYTGADSFTYVISDGHGGTANANVDLTVNPASSTTVSLFNANSTPSMVSVADPNSVELGLKFRASVSGDITGIKFYKGAQNTGTHIANLWSASGTLLAAATFSNETAAGWQQVNFTAPVTISAGTTYIASYHTAGNYSADPNLFANAVANGPLTAPSSSSVGGNGVYAYGSESLFPSNTYNSTSYGVDVLFRAQLAA